MSHGAQLMPAHPHASQIAMRLIIAIGVLSLVFIGQLRAAEGPFPNVPVYNPASQSYFQLFGDNQNPGNWEAAKVRASQKSFKGIRGRLAVVDSAQIHDFVLRTFDLNTRKISVWIGLRYWCNARLLQWEEQRAFSPSDPGHFKIWHAQWSRSDESACTLSKSTKVGFAPVYYRTIGNVTRWQAVGAAKYFNYYLVEFPEKKE